MASNITHYKVFDYWKDKAIDKYGHIYNEQDADFETTEPMIEDWGEPTCFACCASAIDYDNMDDEGKYIEALKREGGLKYIYSRKDVKHNLELCHIKAKALDGTDEPNNVVLLCKRCHRDSPDIVNKELFMSWVFKRKQERHLYIRTYNKACEISKNLYNLNLRKIPVDPSEAFSIKNKRINSHGSYIVESTYVYGYIQEALRLRTQLNQENEKMFKTYINTMIKTIQDQSETLEGSSILIKTLEEILKTYELYKSYEAA